MSAPPLDLLVLADDRTGALETAGACADAGLSTVMIPVASDAVAARATQAAAAPPPWPPAHQCRVIDLGSRHLPPRDAEWRVIDAMVGAPPRRFDAHKIDSTLRGNWADELLARYRASGHRTVLVPAFPAAGRTCVGGVVREHDVPVAEGAAGRDPLRPVASSSPAEHLRHAGAAHVAEIEGATELARWFASQSMFAVCDAAADVEMVLLAEEWATHDDAVFAGTAAAIGAAARVIEPARRRSDLPRITGDVLVVCGSLHRSAREQLAVLRDSGRRHVIVASPNRDETREPDGRVVITNDEAQRTARLLAATARRMLNRRPFDAVVLVGGDTAAAYLGDVPLVVGGTAAVGVPWCRAVDGSGPLLLTKPGGYGDAHALVDVLDAILHP